MVAKRWREGMGVQGCGGRDGGRIEARDGGTELREGMGGRMGAQGW